MSSHAVEIVHRIYSSGAWDSDGDPTAALEFIDAAFEFVNPADAVVPGTRHGHEGFLLAMQSAVDAPMTTERMDAETLSGRRQVLFRQFPQSPGV